MGRYHPHPRGQHKYPHRNTYHGRPVYPPVPPRPRGIKQQAVHVGKVIGTHIRQGVQNKITEVKQDIALKRQLSREEKIEKRNFKHQLQREESYGYREGVAEGRMTQRETALSEARSRGAERAYNEANRGSTRERIGQVASQVRGDMRQAGDILPSAHEMAFNPSAFAYPVPVPRPPKGMGIIDPHSARVMGGGLLGSAAEALRVTGFGPPKVPKELTVKSRRSMSVPKKKGRK